MPKMSILLNCFTLICLVSKIAYCAPIDFDIDRPSSGYHHESQLHGAKIFDIASTKTKFILLTTGEHIKLFTINLNQNNEIEPLDGQEFFLIKPIEFDANNVSTLDRLDRQSPFTKWIQHKHLTKTSQTQNVSALTMASVANIRQSILPKNRGKISQSDEHDDERFYEEEYQSGFRWQKPFLTKVDYFFSSKYCKQLVRNNDKCLVVVWLDKANKFIRFGSINISEKLLTILASNHKIGHQAAQQLPKSTNNSTLWLYEYPPIDLCRQINSTRSNNCEPFDLIIDKNAERLIVIMSDGEVQHSDGFSRANRILSLDLTPNEHYEQQSSFKRIMTFNEDCKPNFKSHQMNFNLLLSKWLIYMERAFGGKVIALDLVSNNFKNNNSLHSNQLQVFDVRANLPIQMIKQTSYEQRNMQVAQQWPSALAMAMDVTNSKFYFLMEDSRVYSSNLSGQNSQCIGQLSAKRAIRSPNNMFVNDGTIYLNDVGRKSLMAYKLPSIIDKLSDNQTKLTQQVLLVEMPNVYDFRIIDIGLSNKPMCYNDRNEVNSNSKDDKKLSTCFKLNQIDANLNNLASNNNKAHCSEINLFGAKNNDTIANSHTNRDCYTEIAWLLILLLFIWLIYGFLFGSSMQLVKYTSATIKSMRRNQLDEDLSAILKTKSNRAEPEKCII